MLYRLTFHNEAYWRSDKLHMNTVYCSRLALVMKYFWEMINVYGRPEEEVVCSSRWFEDKEGHLIGLICEDKDGYNS